MGRRDKKPYLRKRILYFCGRIWARFAIRLAKWLPLKYLHFVAGIFGKIGFYLMKKRRQIAYHNLQIAFGNSKTKSECDEIVKTIFRDTAKNVLEVAKLAYTDPAFLRELISIDGLEYLDNALSQGKGVVALSAHMGNFPIIGPRLILEGYRFNLILRNPKDKILAKTLSDIRIKLGLDSIPDKPRSMCAAKSLASLKKNSILYLQIDQNASSQDLWVDFFGWLVPTFRGPVVFSFRTGAPILPMFIIRDASNHHKLIIKPPFKLINTENKEDDILQNTAKLTKLIEAYIKQYPSQWWWLHRRWKKAKKNN
ncbi:MAG: lysophospholipid acyltransferase family protein [Deltaproteobacteria bacterium]|jgi:KDO2-lipid IV(A) lauroyltransferase|nr:lysophospholipid acyltransferase family protein [Deltaproteobacteria bacterium]